MKKPPQIEQRKWAYIGSKASKPTTWIILLLYIATTSQVLHHQLPFPFSNWRTTKTTTCRHANRRPIQHEAQVSQRYGCRPPAGCSAVSGLAAQLHGRPRHSAPAPGSVGLRPERLSRHALRRRYHKHVHGALPYLAIPAPLAERVRLPQGAGLRRRLQELHDLHGQALGVF